MKGLSAAAPSSGAGSASARRARAQKSLSRLNAMWDAERISAMTYGPEEGLGAGAASAATQARMAEAVRDRKPAPPAVALSRSRRKAESVQPAAAAPGQAAPLAKPLPPKAEAEAPPQAERPHGEQDGRLSARVELSEALNGLMREWALTPAGSRVAEQRDRLPLEWFVDRELAPPAPQEVLAALPRQADGSFRVRGAGVVVGAGAPGHDLAPAAGVWRRILVTGVAAESGLYEVTWCDSTAAGLLDPALACLEEPHDRRVAAARRVQDALARRRDAEALLRRQLIVDAMPITPRVTASLGQAQAGRILVLALARAGSEVGADGITALLEEVQSDYQRTMNALIFDANMAGDGPEAAAARAFVAPPLRDPAPPPPRLGVVVTPPHDFDAARGAFCEATFMTSPQALAASILARRSCIGVGDAQLFRIAQDEPLGCGAFAAAQADALAQAARLLKDKWPQATARDIRGAFGAGAAEAPPRFNVDEISLKAYLRPDNPLLRLLTRVDLVMSDTLCGVVRRGLAAFEAHVRRCCSWTVHVRSTSDVQATHPEAAAAGPPLFAAALVVSPEPRVLNRAAVEARRAEIAAWREGRDAAEGEECPHAPVAPVMGRSVELADAPEAYAAAVAGAHAAAVARMVDVQHVQRYVMERLFWSRPALVKSVDVDDEDVLRGREELSRLVLEASAPLRAYCDAYGEHLELLNLDVEAHVAGLTHAVEQPEDDADDTEPPVAIEVAALRATLERHRGALARLEEEVPRGHVDCGLFRVDVSAVRDRLVAKHADVIARVLDLHARHCLAHCAWLDRRFEAVRARISVQPSDIEETSELEDAIAQVPLATAPLVEGIREGVTYCDVLDDFRHAPPTAAHVTARWTAVGWPKRIDAARAVAERVCIAVRQRFLGEMVSDQARFAASLGALEREVEAFAGMADLAKVDATAALVRAAERRLEEAERMAQLFNSREALFDRDVTEYDQLSRTKHAFEPYAFLWKTAQDWTRLYAGWLNGPFLDIDAELVEQQVDSMNATIGRALKTFERLEMGVQRDLAAQVRAQILGFRPSVPTITALRNPGMRERHWEELSAHLGFRVMPDESFTLSGVLALDLAGHLPAIEKISESAAKEYQIEVALDGMVAEWAGIDLDIFPYRETGTYLLRGVDDVNAVLDEHVTMTQAMQFSSFKGPFEERIEAWNAKLYMVSEVLEAWLGVQRNWLYLQPIFESADINKQLPAEGKKFATVDKAWRQALSAARQAPRAVDFCDNAKLLERFKEGAALLDEVQKGLSDYLETKRTGFARFYFLSNEELLSILSESKDVKLVQPHLKKCFEGIDKVRFEKDLTITAMVSPEGESVDLSSAVVPVGKNVEHWMLELEGEMRASCRDAMEAAIEDYGATPRVEWMQKHVAMCVLNGSQAHWTAETEALFDELGARGPAKALERQRAQLADMVELVRSELPKGTRTTVGALTVVDVHARDVMAKLVDQGVASASEFLWTSQMRYYWQGGQLWAEMVAARRRYGYEYIGNTFRLVITPLTDKCYLTLMGALQMVLGGAPAGPAGTGKTETTKDLSKALAKQCVVFNCSDGLDYIAMGKFFKGLAACGAWACFDEFNRINIEVLSVIGQQIAEIQRAIKLRIPRIVFEGSDIRVDEGFGVFVTMNPGYAGRSALPDSLKALFRPVAMMVPDYALIGEIMFIAYGFKDAKVCGAKMVTTFKLCSEQLSSQPHYDYGMRAVKTVITAAGNLKRAEPDADELVLLLRALQDVNYPKFLEMDLPLFEGIISDLFPGRARPELDYGALFEEMKDEIEARNLQPCPFFLTKVLQLYEMIVVRHGLMVVGGPGGGKSSSIHVLEKTLGRLRARGARGFAYESVRIFQLNPKSITMGQMYGEFDANTHEWQDGIMSTMYREAASSATPDRKWVLFDGPVDAIWIENMNTVLDDNKKLCLNSGEIVKMSPEMTMMFEVMDLAVASPATVSRVGIIYMEPRGLGIDVLLESWMSSVPAAVAPLLRSELQRLFDDYLVPALQYLRGHLVEFVPTLDNQIVESATRVLDCFLEPWAEREGREPPGGERTAALVDRIEGLVLFAVVWSAGATTNEDGRRRFDAFLRGEAASHGSGFPFPEGGLVYDYAFDLGSGRWRPWMTIVDPYDVDPKLSFQELVVPTTDSVRSTYLLDLLTRHRKHVLMVGPTGTGKTVNIQQYLMGAATVDRRSVPSSVLPLSITFSAQTSANMTQDMLDAKMEKRRKGVFGPPAGKTFIVHVDDMNMPKREIYGAQPPIEILRQWFDQAGWYDRKELTFRRIVDLTFVGSMGPPGGGKQEVTPRFTRHFNIVGHVNLSDGSMATIFRTILGSFLSGFEPPCARLCEPIVSASIELYKTIMAELLPTPSKMHYTFNLRDLGKVFQGILMGDARRITEPLQLTRLWLHECRRVFSDRLTNAEDHAWFRRQCEGLLAERFATEWAAACPSERLVYTDFMDPRAEPRVYEETPDVQKLKATVEEYLGEHNAESRSPMPLVMFSDAVEHVARVARVLRQPLGNALLLGVGGSGRQSMTKLATYICGFALFQVEIAKGYSAADWREDIKRCLLNAGLKEKPTTFLFSDVQIVDSTMLEDINNILNAGDVPNLYAPEDLEAIMTACKADCAKRRIPPTRINVFAQYINRVRRNIHMVICMSPLGQVFRDRLLNFPSLVCACYIDWFTEWPSEALQSVGMAQMAEVELGIADDVVASIVETFRTIHQSVEHESRAFFDILRRRNYVTPTSFLELLRSFKDVLAFKRNEVNTKRERLQAGLDKLGSTKDTVGTMQSELEALQPQLKKTTKEVEGMMVQITIDKEEAAETRARVEVEEANANEKAALTREIADDAQRDLDEALPALDAAVQCLNDLSKGDFDEVKALRNPPTGVKLTMEALCIMFSVKPKKVNDPTTPGRKVDDYFTAAKETILRDSKALLQNLRDYDKDNIPDRVINRIAPYIESPDFTPDQIKKASVACRAMCMWTHAMHQYHFVALGVAPKRAALAKAQEELNVVMSQLADAQGRLKGVVDRLAELEENYNAAVAKKGSLEAQAERCVVQLQNAEKLIGGLGGEEARWKEAVATLTVAYANTPGDAVVAAGSVSYLGPFTSEFRGRLVRRWHAAMNEAGVPHTAGCDITSVLKNPVQLRSWQLAGLPTDAVSTENGIMMDKARRWPLLIDPQGQANRYIRNLGRNKENSENGMDICKLSDRNFLRTLENGIRFGKWVLLEDIFEELDAALEPILLQQKFRSNGQWMISLGDNAIAYNDSFRFFMTTKLPNPHYPPELQVRVNLCNFTITPGGLEEQLLDVLLAEEMPGMAERRSQLVVDGAAMNKQLYDIESQILYLLSNSEGNILDDTQLIDTLAQAKATSTEISQKMAEAAETEREISVAREEYRTVANRAALLYFCIADLCMVDPMYQYSLPWYAALFRRGIGNALPASDTPTRLQNLKDHLTYSVYSNVCRSLFEAHKLLLSFLMTMKIMMGAGGVDMVEWRFLITGVSSSPSGAENPDPSWIDPALWSGVLSLDSVPHFRGIAGHFRDHTEQWRAIFDSNDPQEMALPAPYDACSGMQALCVLRVLRKDKVMLAIQNFVSRQLGDRFVVPPPFDLRACYKDSTPATALIFVLSTGSDPMKDLQNLADECGQGDRLDAIALGQGQGAVAEKLVEKGLSEGRWVLLQNCHLSVSWMPELERLCEEMGAGRAHEDFRLWLTSRPSPSFPVSVLQNGVKMTLEPPKGLRANLKATYAKLDDESVSRTTAKKAEFGKMLFGLAFFHALVLERKRFGPLGWNVAYAFNATDLDISAAQLELYMEQYEDIPYRVLQQLVSVVNYGGRITDDKDMRTAEVIIAEIFSPALLGPDFMFSKSGVYRMIEADMDAPHSSYMEYIDSLPLHAQPEVFGMHENANITSDMNEVAEILDTIISLQPRTGSGSGDLGSGGGGGGGGGTSREDIVGEAAKAMEERVPAPFDIEAMSLRYPTDYNECRNTTLVQEAQRYNALLSATAKTLATLQRALKGLVVMSSELEEMATAIFNQQVPPIWSRNAYPSLMPLTPWFNDFVRRIEFIAKWHEDGLPPSFWISGLTFPQGFITAVTQNLARRYRLPIDTVSMGYVMRDESVEEIACAPDDGCYIYGLFLEGARWDKAAQSLVDPTPKELFSPMPVIHLLPEQHREQPETGIARIPVYKILTRAGVLSTTGHSTNFVTWLQVPSKGKEVWRAALVSETNATARYVDKLDWVRGGVAAFCALRY